MAARERDPTRIEDLLRQRSELDQRLARYRRSFAVLFADVSGSTRFFDQRGDLSGVAMVQQFVDQAEPSIRRHQGRIVKTLGDGILAYFEDATAAVRAAAELQQEFAALNVARATGDRIELRIGINYGTGFVKEGDIFGDVVNIASRLEELARPNQIVVSAPVAEAARAAGYSLAEVGPLELRGKAGTQPVYEVVWQVAGGAAPPHVYTLLVLDASGAPTAEYPLARAETLLGRREGDIRFPRDALMAPQHARFSLEEGALWAEDLSPTGVFLRLRQPVVLAAGDTFLIGKELVEFQFGGAGAGEAGWLLAGRKRFPISGQGLLLGRTQGDVTFADDPQVSTRHAGVRREGRRWLLEDLGSTNGTYLKIRGRCRLESGDILLCGSQLLRVR